MMIGRDHELAQLPPHILRRQEARHRIDPCRPAPRNPQVNLQFVCTPDLTRNLVQRDAQFLRRHLHQRRIGTGPLVEDRRPDDRRAVGLQRDVGGALAATAAAVADPAVAAADLRRRPRDLALGRHRQREERDGAENDGRGGVAEEGKRPHHPPPRRGRPPAGTPGEKASGMMSAKEVLDGRSEDDYPELKYEDTELRHDKEKNRLVVVRKAQKKGGRRGGRR